MGVRGQGRSGGQRSERGVGQRSGEGCGSEIRKGWGSDIRDGLWLRDQEGVGVRDAGLGCAVNPGRALDWTSSTSEMKSNVCLT